MYTLVTAGAAVMLWVVTWVVKHPAQAAHVSTSRRMWAAYGAASIVVMYAHNTGIITVTAMAMVFSVYWITGRRDPRILYHFLVTQVTALLLWLPFSYAYAIQAINVFGGLESGDVIVTQDWFTTVRNMWFPYFFSEWRWVFEGGLLVLFAYGLWTVRHFPRWLTMLAVAPMFTIALVTAADQLTPMFTARAVIWTLVPMTIAIAIAVARLPLSLRGLTLAGLLIPVTMGLSVYYTSPAQANFEMIYDPWPEAATYIAQRADPDDVVLLSPGYIEPTFDYYYPDDDATQRTDVLTAASASDIEDLIDDADAVWVVRTADRGWDPDQVLEATLTDTHSPGEAVKMDGIEVQRYSMSTSP